MTDTVVSLKPKAAHIRSTQKQQLLDAVAASFDAYVEDFGCEPEGITYQLGGIKQRTRSGWLMTGESVDDAASVMAKAHAVLLKDIIG